MVRFGRHFGSVDSLSRTPQTAEEEQGILTNVTKQTVRNTNVIRTAVKYTRSMADLLLLDFTGLGVKPQQGAPCSQLRMHQLKNGLCCKLLAFAFVLAPNLK